MLKYDTDVALHLRPGQRLMSPAVFIAAMEVLIERALEAVQHVVYIGKTGLFKHFARIDRASTTTANQNHWPRFHPRDERFDVGCEFGIDIPIRRLLPGHMFGTHGMADIEKLNFRANIDKHGVGIRVKKFVGFFGCEVFHCCFAALGKGRRAFGTETTRLRARTTHLWWYDSKAESSLFCFAGFHLNVEVRCLHDRVVAYAYANCALIVFEGKWIE
jgi:hypothetical protein